MNSRNVAERLCLLFSALLLFWSLGLWCRPKLDPPSLSVSTDVVDFGEVSAGQAVTGTVVLTNSGDLPLQITEVRSSCGCTVADLSSTQIPEGASASLQIRFVPDSGLTAKSTIRIRSNDSQQPERIVTVRSRRPELVFVTPRRLLIHADQADHGTNAILIRTNQATLLNNDNAFFASAGIVGLEATIEKGLDPSSQKVRLTLTDDFPSGMTHTNIRIRDRTGRVSEVVKVDVDKASRWLQPRTRHVFVGNDRPLAVELVALNDRSCTETAVIRSVGFAESDAPFVVERFDSTLPSTVTLSRLGRGVMKDPPQHATWKGHLKVEVGDGTNFELFHVPIVSITRHDRTESDDRPRAARSELE
jgi:hypothetical protein